MKIRCYYLVSVAFFFLTYTALSADADLVTLLKGGQQSSEISKYLEPGPMPSQPKDEHSRTLRAVIAFGHVFEGEVTFKVDAQAKLLMWTQDPSIPPQAGVELFEKIARVLKSQYGPGKNIASIPNYGDASDVKSTAVLWLLETDIVLLKLEQYPSRAGISIVKRSSESWRSSMGADESEFWAQTLDSKMDAGPSPPQCNKRLVTTEASPC